MWMRNKTSEENEEKIAETPIQPIVDMGSCVVRSDRGTVHCLTVVGQIEGHTLLPQNSKTTKYEHVMPLLAALEENNEVDGVLLLLNTVGGDVEAGLALAELVAGISKPTVSLVIGGGHSIGIPLAVSADYAFVAKSATMTLHPIRTSGTVITAEPTFEYMRKTQERVVDFIVEHSRAPRQAIEEKMNCTSNMANDVGTLLFGPEAVELGLMDEVGSLRQALEKLRQLAGGEKGEPESAG